MNSRSGLSLTLLMGKEEEKKTNNIKAHVELLRIKS